MESKDEIMIVSQETLVNKIYTIRGQKVMLDFELAECQRRVRNYHIVPG